MYINVVKSNLAFLYKIRRNLFCDLTLTSPKWVNIFKFYTDLEKYYAPALTDIVRYK